MDNSKIVIETQNLTKKFGNFTAVNNICLKIFSGEIFGFLGANGAGKTTAIRILCGLLSPTSGIAKVAGFDVYTKSEEIKKQIGYMSQKFSLYENLTVKENMHFFGGIYGIPRNELKIKIDVLIEKLGFQNQVNKLVGSLPLGWKQKISFSTAILHQPKIVFLDEPTAGVDPITRRQFWNLIYDAANNGITIFVTTHYMDEAEYCNRVSIMVDGAIAALDTPLELKKIYSSNSMDEVFLQLARGAKRTD